MNETHKLNSEEKKVLNQLKEIYSVDYEEIAYIGDSLVDIPVLDIVGYPISVPDGHELAKKEALFITKKKGGEGVLLEVVEKILEGQERYEDVLQLMKNDKFK